MRLQAAIQGNLKAMMAAEVKAAEKAVSGGVRQATDGLKNELRSQVTGAGLGERLAKSWRGDLYPKGGMSINAAGFIYTKAPEIIGAFAYGATIRSKGGRFLAIPTQYVTRRQNKKITPADFAEAGIPLRYVPPHGARRVGLLVADDFRVTSKGKARAASDRAKKTGRGLTTVVMFMPAYVFANAPRYHTGGVAGLKPGEIPAILERGEVVLPKDGTRMGSPVNVVMNITTPDASSFRMSQSQITAEAARGIQRAKRNL